MFDENSPLLSPAPKAVGVLNGNGRLANFGDEEEGWTPRTFLASALKSVKTQVDKPRINIQGAELQAKMRKEVANAPHYAAVAVRALPSVLLGCLLNILDGVSCKFSLFSFFFFFGADIFGLGSDPMVPWLSFHLAKSFLGSDWLGACWVYGPLRHRCGPRHVGQDVGRSHFHAHRVIYVADHTRILSFLFCTFCAPQLMDRIRFTPRDRASPGTHC